jgi:hypothetical protein
MRSLNWTAAGVLGCLSLALVLTVPSLIQADDWNLATRFTVNQPFQVPGTVLQPNTPYVIRLYDSPSERQVVQIYNEDQTHMLTMFIAINAERLEATDKSVFTFMETEPGYPVPMKEWFYPGRLNGREFVYPKKQALEIALHGRNAGLTQTAAITKSENTSVLEEKPSVAENLPTEESEINQQAEQHVEPVEPEQIAQNDPPELQKPEAAPAAPATEETRELPRTAGELPLIGLIGILCMGAGLGLKVVSSRS